MGSRRRRCQSGRSCHGPEQSEGCRGGLEPHWTDQRRRPCHRRRHRCRGARPGLHRGGVGGVWKTTNANSTYEPAWPDDLTQAVGALAMSPNGTLFAGTGETNPGGGSRRSAARACTGPVTAASPGSGSASSARARSAASSPILVSRGSCMPRRPVTCTCPAGSAASSSPGCGTCRAAYLRRPVVQQQVVARAAGRGRQDRRDEAAPYRQVGQHPEGGPHPLRGGAGRLTSGTRRRTPAPKARWRRPTTPGPGRCGCRPDR